LPTYNIDVKFVVDEAGGLAQVDHFIAAAEEKLKKIQAQINVAYGSGGGGGAKGPPNQPNNAATAGMPNGWNPWSQPVQANPNAGTQLALYKELNTQTSQASSAMAAMAKTTADQTKAGKQQVSTTELISYGITRLGLKFLQLETQVGTYAATQARTNQALATQAGGIATSQQGQVGGGFFGWQPSFNGPRGSLFSNIRDVYGKDFGTDINQVYALGQRLANTGGRLTNDQLSQQVKEAIQISEATNTPLETTGGLFQQINQERLNPAYRGHISTELWNQANTMLGSDPNNPNGYLYSATMRYMQQNPMVRGNPNAQQMERLDLSDPNNFQAFIRAAGATFTPDQFEQIMADAINTASPMANTNGVPGTTDMSIAGRQGQYDTTFAGSTQRFENAVQKFAEAVLGNPIASFNQWWQSAILGNTGQGAANPQGGYNTPAVIGGGVESIGGLILGALGTFFGVGLAGRALTGITGVSPGAFARSIFRRGGASGSGGTPAGGGGGGGGGTPAGGGGTPAEGEAATVVNEAAPAAATLSRGAKLAGGAKLGAVAAGLDVATALATGQDPRRAAIVGGTTIATTAIGSLFDEVLGPFGTMGGMAAGGPLGNMLADALLGKENVNGTVSGATGAAGAGDDAQSRLVTQTVILTNSFRDLAAYADKLVQAYKNSGGTTAGPGGTPSGGGGGGAAGGGGGNSAYNSIFPPGKGILGGTATAGAGTSDVNATGDQTEAYIRQAAIARGIDPDVAVKVWRGEGAQTGAGQSRNINPATGQREASYGPFQLNTDVGWGKGAIAAGIDPRDAQNWQADVDYALNQVLQGGWDPGASPGHYGAGLHGATRQGITNWQGISGHGDGTAAALKGVANYSGNSGSNVNVGNVNVTLNTQGNFQDAHLRQIAGQLTPMIMDNMTTALQQSSNNMPSTDTLTSVISQQ
jgi:hypothetical protein